MHPYRTDNDDEATERVLRALDAAQPAAGFEKRVLQGLAQQRLYAQQPARRFGLATLSVLAGAGCAAAVLVLLLLVHLGPKHSPTSLHVGTVASSPASSAPTAARPADDLPMVAARAAHPHGAPKAAIPVSAKHARHEVELSPSTANKDSANSVAQARDLDQQALDDLHAESVPPPPLPPTAQERMVKLMLRRGEKHDLAQLDPAQSLRLTDAEQRSFQTFFDPDPSPELALELKKGNLR